MTFPRALARASNQPDYDRVHAMSLVNAEKVAEAIAANFRDAGFELSSTVLGNEAVTVAFRPSPAAVALIAQPPAIDLESMKSLLNEALRGSFDQERQQQNWFNWLYRDFGADDVVVVVSETVDSQVKLWVRRRWVDDSGFPVIVDATTGEVVYRERLTLLGAIGSVVKRRLVKRIVVPAAAEVLHRKA